MKTQLSIAAMIAAMSTCFTPISVAASTSITVATYGGEWGAALQACIIDPFTTATGIKVTPEPGVSGVTLSKLLQQKDAPVLDAVWLDGGVSEQAAAQGVLGEITLESVPGAMNVLEEGVYKDASGQIFALSTGFYSLGLVYNKDQVTSVPKSWNDLWSDEFKGAVTFPSPSNAMGVPFLVEIAKKNGTTIDKMAPALDAIQKLEVAAYFDTAGAGTNLFQSGEVVAGAHYASSAYAMKDQNLPIEFVVPTEGAIGGDIRIHLVANTPRKEAAEKFIDFAVSKNASQCLADKIFVGPATKDVQPGTDASNKMPWGVGGSVKSLSLPDWNAINENRANIIEEFNRTVTAKD